MPNAVEVAYAAVADTVATALGGVPIATPGALISRHFEKKKVDAQRILLDELSKGKKPELELRDCEDHIDILFSFYYAAMRGRARENLRLLARLIVNLNDCDELYASKFDRHQTVLSELDIDEIRVLAFAAKQLLEEREVRPGIKSIHIHTGRLGEEAFGERKEYAGGALSKVVRSGYICTFVTGGGVGSGGTLVYKTTPAFLEILDILDSAIFESAPSN
ncbi:hypothetical protein [Hyphococcus sp.]|uniref:hypothetical protein n=1 Tax=Hyphococcus sp. TaxID=2038636 RepID=UPI0035C6E06C